MPPISNKRWFQERKLCTFVVTYSVVTYHHGNSQTNQACWERYSLLQSWLTVYGIIILPDQLKRLAEIKPLRVVLRDLNRHTTGCSDQDVLLQPTGSSCLLLHSIDQLLEASSVLIRSIPNNSEATRQSDSSTIYLMLLKYSINFYWIVKNYSLIC